MQSYFFHPRDLETTAGHLFWSAPPDEALVRSLDRLGQMTPALVVFDGDRPVLAAGSRRASARRQLRGRSLAAVVPEPDEVSPALAALPQALRLGVAYLASNLGRAVTDPMLAAAGRYFLAHGSWADCETLAGPYLFAPGDRRARQLARWLTLPPALDALLASGHLPLAAAGALADCDPATLAAFAPLFAAVRWSRANLEKVLVWTREAAAMTGETPAAVLGRSEALSLSGRGLSPNDLTAGVMAAVRRMRYPATASLEARFTVISRELTRGSRLRLKPSQGFEADAVTVELTARSPAELAAAADRLTAMAGHPDLPRLLHLAEDEGEPA